MFRRWREMDSNHRGLQDKLPLRDGHLTVPLAERDSFLFAAGNGYDEAAVRDAEAKVCSRITSIPAKCSSVAVVGPLSRRKIRRSRVRPKALGVVSALRSTATQSSSSVFARLVEDERSRTCPAPFLGMSPTRRRYRGRTPARSGRRLACAAHGKPTIPRVTRSGTRSWAGRL
jgi:hypothetical protein